MTAARISHEDLTAAVETLAELRDDAARRNEPVLAFAYARALSVLRTYSGGEYGERMSKVRLWAVAWRFRSGLNHP